MTQLNQLQQLKQTSTVVADTGDFLQLARFAPQDATTNPSLILKAVLQPDYAPLLESTVAAHKTAALDDIVDAVLVRFGLEILKVVPGRVSTEVDARLSFDRDATVARARRLIALYEQAGVKRERVLIKIVATWEGIQAARELEADGIFCNLTLLFAFCQAVACADAKVRLISPFVGRIYDWHKKARNLTDIPRAEDPGVASVVRIYNYYKKFDHATQVMGASFRKVEQIIDLAGADLLTISPELLAQLAAREGEVARALDPARAKTLELEPIHLDEKGYRWMHNEDAMAVEKLSEGIRQFNADARKLEAYAQAEVAKGT